MLDIRDSGLVLTALDLLTFIVQSLAHSEMFQKIETFGFGRFIFYVVLN